MTRQKLKNMGFTLHEGGWITYGVISITKNESKLTEKQLVRKLSSEVWKEAHKQGSNQVSDSIKKALNIR